MLQSGARADGVGLGAGVGGLAGAEGSVLPGMTFGLVGIGIGMVGTLVVDDDGVLIGRGRACVARALPRVEWKRLLYDCDCTRTSVSCSSSVGDA